MSRSCIQLFAASLFLSSAAMAAPNGLYTDSPSARGMSLGGAETAAAMSPLEALSANPAALGEIGRAAIEVGVVAGFVEGDFHNRANRNGATFSDSGAYPTERSRPPQARCVSVSASIQ